MAVDERLGPSPANVATGGVRRPHFWGRRGSWGAYVLFIPALALLLFISIFPLLYELVVSFFRYDPVIIGNAKFVGIQNFVDLITDPGLQNVFLRTAVFALVVVSVEFVIGSGLAILAADHITTGGTFFKTLLLLPMAMTPVAAGLVWRWLFDPDVGLVNYFLGFFGVHPILWLGNTDTALWALGVVDIWQWTPLVFLMMLAGLTSLPREPLEAAAVDGANWWQTLTRVTLPMLRSLVVVVLVIRAVDVLKLFDLVYVMTEGGPGTSTELTSYSIYKIAFRYFNQGQGAALSWIVLILVLVVSSPFLNRLAKEQWAAE